MNNERKERLPPKIVIRSFGAAIEGRTVPKQGPKTCLCVRAYRWFRDSRQFLRQLTPFAVLWLFARVRSFFAGWSSSQMKCAVDYLFAVEEMPPFDRILYIPGTRYSD